MATPSPEPNPDGGVQEAVRTGVANATDWAATSLRIAFVIVAAVLLRYAFHRGIRRVVARAIANPTVPEALRSRFGEPTTTALERRKQRAETVGSVLRSVATIVVFGVAFATVLGELGVDLGPILASAGIIGVAIGFGAQNLVRDFLNGIFMILEDQYGVGDAVDVGEANGIVESVGLRTTRLRSVDGTVWHVRNGEIVRVGNMSQGWSRALLDVSVAYGSDVERAQQVIKRVAVDVMNSEEVGAFVLDEPEVWGVERLGADGIDIRLVVKTAPLEQWKVARELRRRLKHAFDEERIEIPFPQRSLWLRTSPDALPSPVTDDDTPAPPRGRKAATRPKKSARGGRTRGAGAGAPAGGTGAAPPAGEADAARSDSGALHRPGPVSPTGPVDDGRGPGEPRPAARG